jgi:hypothetical protein
MKALDMGLAMTYSMTALALSVACLIATCGSGLAQTSETKRSLDAKMADLKKVMSVEYQTEFMDRRFELVGSQLRLSPIQFGEARRQATSWYATAACATAGSLTYERLTELQQFSFSLYPNRPQDAAAAQFVVMLLSQDIGKPSPDSFPCKYAKRAAGR